MVPGLRAVRRHCGTCGLVLGEKYKAVIIKETNLFGPIFATLAYRAAKVLRDVPAGFAEFSIEPRARVPVQILAHMGDLMGWAVRMAEGEYLWRAEGTRD